MSVFVRTLNQDSSLHSCADEFDEIQSRVVRGITLFCAIVGVPALAIGMIEALKLGQRSAAVVYLCAYLPVAAASLFGRRSGVRVRGAAVIAALLLLATHNFVLWGLSGVAIPTLVVASVLATSVFGITGGAVTVSIGLVPLCVSGVLMSTGRIEVAIDVLSMSTDPISWLTAGMIVVLYSGIASVSSGSIFVQLRRALARSERTSAALDRSVQTLEHRVQVEEAITGASTRLMAAPDDRFEENLRDALRRVGAAIGASAATVEIDGRGEIEVGIIARWRGDDGSTFESGADGMTRETIPLLASGASIGRVSMDCRKDQWQEADLSLLRMFSQVIQHAALGHIERRERRQIDIRLNQAQKLESVGRLAGGVAHDFNNLLTVILGSVEMAADSQENPPETERYLSEVRHAAERAAGLTTRLLAYSRQQVLEPEDLAVDEALRSIHVMLTRIIGEDISVVIDIEPEVGLIRVDPSQFEQIVMNLATNARDAMPTGGRLTIQASRIEADQEYCRLHPGLAKGGSVLLEVSDSGCGMGADTVARIFEPFFTTKAVGSGTGLGLASVYGTVTQSGGHIEVESEPDLGTAFRIFFPAVKPPRRTFARE